MKKTRSSVLFTIFLILTGCHAVLDQRIDGNNDQITIGVSEKPT